MNELNKIERIKVENRIANIERILERNHERKDSVLYNKLGHIRHEYSCGNLRQCNEEIEHLERYIRVLNDIFKSK